MSQVRGEYAPDIKIISALVHVTVRNGLSRADLTCVPLMVAASPGKVHGEAAKEVEEGPGQNNDVVDVEEDDNHLGGVANAWRGKLQNWARDSGTDSSRATPPSVGRGLYSTVSARKRC